MEKFFYYAEICNTIGVITGVFLFIVGLCILIFFIGSYLGVSDEIAKWKTLSKKFFIILCVTMVLHIVTPSKRTLYLMKGFGIIENTLNDSTAKHLPSKTIELLNEYLDNELKQLRKEK